VYGGEAGVRQYNERSALAPSMAGFTPNIHCAQAPFVEHDDKKQRIA
jgi:hypothetical protein